MLEAILLAAAYKVGVYASPHLVRYNERIRIDVGARTWSSDFRGLAEGQGRCEPLDAAQERAARATGWR